MTTNNNNNVHSEHATGWRGRGDLQTMVDELKRQLDSKVDFVADTRGVNIQADNNQLLVRPASPQTGEFIDAAGVPFATRAAKQFGERCTPRVPVKFTEQLATDHPDIAAALLNDLSHATPARRLFRCLDGQVRAVLSDRYRVMDNYDLALTALNAVREHEGEVVECALSDTKMRLKFTTRAVFDAIEENRKGDSGSWYAGGMGDGAHLRRVGARTGGELPGGPGTVHPLVTISNSETGNGGLNVRVGILRAICFNLSTVEDVQCKVHLGGQMDAGIFTAETISADSKVIMMKCSDAITAAFQPDVFARLVARCNEANSDVIAAPTAAVDNLVGNAGLSETARDEILSHFLRDYDSTRYGLAQAVSRHAQSFDDADAGTDMEDVAGALIASPALVS